MRFDEMAKRWSKDAEYAQARARELPKGYLGVNVLRLRTRAGLTQQELARLAGVRQPRIAEIERGDANPQLETLGRLAYALKVEVANLVENPETVGVSDFVEIEQVEVALDEPVDLVRALKAAWDADPWKQVA